MKKIAWFTLATLRLALACDESTEPSSGIQVPTDAAADQASAPTNDASSEMLPNDLAATGLYDDVATKRIASRIRSYAPPLRRVCARSRNGS